MPRFRRLATACTVLVLAAGCRQGSATTARAAPPAVDVQLVAATLTPLADTVTAHGTLAADEDVDLAFELAGTLATLAVDLGSRVQAADTLATLDVTTTTLEVRVAEAAVRQARARLGLTPDGDDDRVDPEQTPAVRQAKAMVTETRLALERMQALEKQSLLAEANLETARSAHEVAESRLASAYNEVKDHVVTLGQRRVEAELARRRIALSKLQAPFAGLIAARLRIPPEYVRAGEAVVSLLRTDPLRLRLRIPERDASRLASGQAVRFTADGVPGEHLGRVQRLSPQIDPETRTLLIEAMVDNAKGELRPGLFARALVEVGAPAPRVTLPRTAIAAFAGVEKVFVVEGEVARENPVQTGRRIGELVEVVDGVAAGLQVVLAAEGLVSGQPVRVVGR